MALPGSSAKVHRAREHADAFDSEIKRVMGQGQTYATRLEYDEDTHWGSLIGSIPEPSEAMLRAAAIAGDCVHNLRAALDYIVTELVRIAKADLLRQHQFPIFDDQGKFARTVGPDIRHLNARGPLVGITLGFDTIEQLQPYKRGNSAREDPLFLLHSLSNADKHRQILDWQLLVAKATGSVDFGVPVLKQTPGRVLPGLFANREQELLRVRFGGVPPTNYDLTAQVDAHLWFVCAPVKGEKRLLIPHSVLDSLCEHVSMVLDLFEKHVLSDPP